MDDDLLVNEIIEEHLIEQGYDIKIAFNGTKAEEILTPAIFITSLTLMDKHSNKKRNITKTTSQNLNSSGNLKPNHADDWDSF